MPIFFGGVEQSRAYIQGRRVSSIFKNGQQIFNYVPKSYSLTNILSNGGFETNVTGWTSNFGGAQPTRIAVPTPVHGEVGSWCLQNTGTINGAHYVQLTTAQAITNGNRYYVRARVRFSTAGFGNIMTFMNAATALAEIDAPTLTVNQWTTIDGIWTANAATLQLRVNFSGGNGNQLRTAQVDNVMLINLTTPFGSDIPELNALKSAIFNVGGFWDGTNTVLV